MDNMDNMYLIFTAADKRFALPFDAVRIILTGKKPEKIPDFPDYVEGSIVNEGHISAVINLRRRFGYPEKEYSDRDCIIVINGEEGVSFMCDGIEGFINVAQKVIMPSPEFNEDTAAKFIKGEFLDEDGILCYIIDPVLVIKAEDMDTILQKK